MSEPAAEAKHSATDTSEMLTWDSKARRVVVLYLPLFCFLIILLFPFYWMAMTSFKPNAELYDLENHNPFWITLADARRTSITCCSRRPIRTGCGRR